MRHALGKLVLIPLACSLAFGLTYVSVNHAFGKSTAATPLEAGVRQDVPATSTPDFAATPEDTSPVAPVETRVPGSPPSFDELGDLAEEGSLFQKYGVRLQIPEGLGDFRVLYPVIVDWGRAPDADHPNTIMTVYNPQTRSSLFLRFEGSAEGPRAVELGRHVERAEANAALDSIASTAEVTR